MKSPLPHRPANVKKIHQWYYRADDIEHKTALLIHLLEAAGSNPPIVLVRKRERVHELAAKLHEAGINTCWLGGRDGAD
ncbi:hypothetical protein LNP25_32445 [Klebsiella variicola subsp. variicola]|nr:hypothetical protein [Klebsiella variicola subsp. variicola]